MLDMTMTTMSTERFGYSAIGKPLVIGDNAALRKECCFGQL